MMRIVLVTLVLALAAGLVLPGLIICAEGQPGAELSVSLKDFEDQGDFVLYVNEEVIVNSECHWEASGHFTSAYTLSAGGQSIASSMEIQADDQGQWTSISMETPQGPVRIAREGALARITTEKEVQTVELRPSTLLFENFSPSLMSLAVLAYDQAAGGAQTFPIFIIPAVVLDASIERLETVERTVAGRTQTFTLYRYGLPGVDVTIWTDEAHRVCYGDVPAQHAAYVREGYDVLRLQTEPDSTLSQPRYDVILDDDVKVPMRDGIMLSTDIYRPQGHGRFPVILVRTPYKKEMNELQAKFFARRGYVYAVQDCRGRFASEGEWNPFFDEPADGYDTIEWLAVQPWSTGKVGMIGGSYVGWVQWWAAREHPPHLAAMIPNVAPPDPYFNIPYEYGALFLLGAIWWADVLEQEATADLSGKAMQEIGEKKYAKLLRHLPVVELDELVLGKQNAYWREWIAHPDNDEYWARASFLARLQGLDVPVFHQSGWFDGDGIGSKLNYLAMVRQGNRNQKLTLGPWGHTASAMRLGPRLTDFGPNAITDLERAYVRWLDRWLKGVDNGIDREPLVSLFVMGTNKWVVGDTYPLAETQFTKFYLASGGKANTSAGDGRLVTAAAEGAPFDTYVYDPGDPTLDPNFYFNPEDTLETSGETAAGLKEVSVEEEQARVRAYYEAVDSSREDILVYDTEPLTEPVTFAGPISAVLYAASSARDTDWFMRLSKVGATGEVFPLVHGVIRARYRDSFSQPEMLTPGEIYEYHLDMWQTGITVPPGERLRVEVASASFPTFSRNLNTGEHNETGTDYVPATQKVYHDSAHPSHILLPVLREPAFRDKID
jgi:putative CocE/NonD family hydrolase